MKVKNGKNGKVMKIRNVAIKLYVVTLYNKALTLSLQIYIFSFYGYRKHEKVY